MAAWAWLRSGPGRAAIPAEVLNAPLMPDDEENPRPVVNEASPVNAKAVPHDKVGEDKVQSMATLPVTPLYYRLRPSPAERAQPRDDWVANDDHHLLVAPKFPPFLQWPGWWLAWLRALISVAQGRRRG